MIFLSIKLLSKSSLSYLFLLLLLWQFSLFFPFVKCSESTNYRQSIIDTQESIADDQRDLQMEELFRNQAHEEEKEESFRPTIQSDDEDVVDVLPPPIISSDFEDDPEEKELSRQQRRYEFEETQREIEAERETTEMQDYPSTHNEDETIEEHTSQRGLFPLISSDHEHFDPPTFNHERIEIHPPPPPSSFNSLIPSESPPLYPTALQRQPSTDSSFSLRDISEIEKEQPTPTPESRTRRRKQDLEDDFGPTMQEIYRQNSELFNLIGTAHTPIHPPSDIQMAFSEEPSEQELEPEREMEINFKDESGSEWFISLQSPSDPPPRFIRNPSLESITPLPLNLSNQELERERELERELEIEQRLERERDQLSKEQQDSKQRFLDKESTMDQVSIIREKDQESSHDSVIESIASQRAPHVPSLSEFPISELESESDADIEDEREETISLKEEGIKEISKKESENPKTESKNETSQMEIETEAETRTGIDQDEMEIDEDEIVAILSPSPPSRQDEDQDDEDDTSITFSTRSRPRQDRHGNRKRERSCFYCFDSFSFLKSKKRKIHESDPSCIISKVESNLFNQIRFRII